MINILPHSGQAIRDAPGLPLPFWPLSDCSRCLSNSGALADIYKHLKLLSLFVGFHNESWLEKIC